MKSNLDKNGHIVPTLPNLDEMLGLSPVFFLPGVGKVNRAAFIRTVMGLVEVTYYPRNGAPFKGHTPVLSVVVINEKIQSAEPMDKVFPLRVFGLN